MFTGSITALITPFHQGNLDSDAFASLIERQITAGTHGLVPSGTTGESPTLDHDEHNHVTELCVEVTAGRVPVIAGTGSNATSEAIMMTQHAQKVGADAALIAVPYYNKPTTEGLFQHYKAIHDSTDIPIILYNVPGRTVVDMQNDTVARIVEALPRVVGIKDATGDLTRPADLATRLGDTHKDFIQISGEDDTVVEFYQQGGKGCISVTSNIVPEQCGAMHDALLKEDYDTAKEIQDMLMPLHQVMFCESSPGPVKYAASLLGLCSEEMRLPLVPPSEENKAKIRAVLEQLNLI